MNITYLIGNGFDLNLGLRTRYADFINWLNNIGPSANESVIQLQDSIRDYCKKKDIGEPTEINWSDTETAFGQFTYLFNGKPNGDEEIDDCHSFLCKMLSEYLKNEEEKVPISEIVNNKDKLEELAKALLNYTVGLRPVDVNRINKRISKIGNGIYVRGIDFNYTGIVDNLFSEIEKQSLMGTRVSFNTRYNNAIYSPIHVHGTVTHGMIFGLDNETQICCDAFDDNEPERKRALIKKFANEDLGEETDEQVRRIINDSNVIYVYGMSLGITDQRWWECIVDKLNNDKECILIIQGMDVPEIGLKSAPYMKYCRTHRDEFLQYNHNLDEKQIESIKQRIYYTKANIFSSLEKIVESKSI